MLRLDAAGLAPFDELGHVQTAVGGFTVVDPRLGLAKSLPKLPLGQTGFLSQGAKQARQGLVTATMLGLRGHENSVPRIGLDTISVSDEDGGVKTIDGFDKGECIDDEDPLTPEEQKILEIRFMLDEAFRRDPSIGAMNRVYRKLRTGDAETDRAIRDHIGMLYLLDRARPALLKAMRQSGMDREPAFSEVTST